MIQDNRNSHYWRADEGKAFVRKVDNVVMGDMLYLNKFIDGTPDTIDNYKEVELEIAEEECEY